MNSKTYSPSITILLNSRSGLEALVPQPAGALSLGHTLAPLKQ